MSFEFLKGSCRASGCTDLIPAANAHGTGEICADETLTRDVVTAILPARQSTFLARCPERRQTPEGDHGSPSRTILTRIHAMAKRNPVTRPESITGLYWSNCGDVLCLEHARDIGAPQWEKEEWAPLPAVSQHRTKGWRYQCQRCSPDGRAVVHAVAHKRLVRRKANTGRLRRALSVFALLAFLKRLLTSIWRRRKTV